jgi:hypothetical protein
VALHRMQVAVESGQPQQVLAAARQMPDEALPTPERRATYWVDLGRAHAMMRRDDEAVRMFRRAEGIAAARVRLHPMAREAVTGMLGRRQRGAVGRDLRGLAFRMGLPH